MSIQLPAAQYRSYDMDGEILATRSVKVHDLNPRSEFGPGIVAALRTGLEPDTGDGIGVELTITDEQLVALGYTRIEPLTAALQAMADSIFDPLPFDGEDIEEMVEAAEPPAAPNMLDLLGGIPLETYQEAVRRAFPNNDGGSHIDPAVHLTPGYECLHLEAIREKVVEIINEDLARERQGKFVFCPMGGYHGGETGVGTMVGGEGDPSLKSFHDGEAQIYCTILGKFIPVGGHYFASRREWARCVDQTGNMVHPEAK